ncbi:MAG: YccF domain-containing protein [Oscillospiraceae bacterium]|jgi:uncharacterized membrane protein YccF (DUF307 family)|nr:YccF domain-containing protein [Oscillospiraceae bacterium]
MRLLENITWVILGGAILSFLWFITGILLCLTIIYIPFGVECFKLSKFILWPFGKRIVYTNKIENLVLNIIWVLFFGWELALTSLFIGILWCITIIGVPFGIQCFKFAELALMPFGARIIVPEKDQFIE